VRIAYDLRYAGDHFPGIGRFAYSALRGLLESARDDHFDVLWRPGDRSPYDLERIRRHAAVRWVETPAAPLGLGGAWRLGTELRRLRPDLYLSPFWHAPLGIRIPMILTLYDVLPLRTPRDYNPGKVLAMRLALRFLAKRAQWLTVSEWSRREILDTTPIPAEALHVLRMFLSPERSVGDVAPSWAPTGPFAMVVATDRPHKNLEVLAKAWSLLNTATRPPLLWAGGQDVSRSEDEVRGGFVALGRVSDADLAWLYAHATVMLFPSTYEGFGIPLLEAMTAGVPAIVSDIPVFHEVAGDAACYVDPHDPKAWAGALTRLLADPAERSRFANLGPARAREFDVSRAAGQLRDLIGVVAGRR
jgi:alpha-1,3-rhamnosyl/mannosyltransferase